MPDGSWVDHLDQEDLAFLRRFLMASGTLKEVARQYGISYPTVRLRLDRLIQKVRLVGEARSSSPFEQRLRSALADGRMGAGSCLALVDAYLEGAQARV